MVAMAAIGKGYRMKAVKALVIFMGVLLVLGVGVLGYGMYSKAGRLAKPSTPVAAPAEAVLVAAGGPFSPVSLGQPEGSMIAGMQWSGPLLAVQIKGGGLPDRVMVINTANGSVNGEINLGQALGAAPVVPQAAPLAR